MTTEHGWHWTAVVQLYSFWPNTLADLIVAALSGHSQKAKSDTSEGAKDCESIKQNQKATTPYDNGQMKCL